MPQLDISSYTSQIFWFIIFFSIIYLFINYWFVPKMDQIFIKRDRVIKTLAHEAEKLKNQLRLAKERQEMAEIELKQEIAQIHQETEKLATEYFEEQSNILQQEYRNKEQILKAELAELKANFEKEAKQHILSLSTSVMMVIHKKFDSNKVEEKIKKQLNI